MTSQRSIVLVHGVQASRLTWWRLAQDLRDLGWQVHAVDLLGHGTRHGAGPATLTIDHLADDVAAQVPGPVDVLAGHSLGAIVALTLLRQQPDYCRRVVIEDPPGLAGSLGLDGVADAIAESVWAARTDPVGTVESLLVANPSWSRIDALNSVQNREMLDVQRVTELLRTDRWDLQALVGECPVPVLLLAATHDSALTDPDRSALVARLPAEHVAVIDSGHDLHRERPALWLHHVLSFASG